MFVFTSFSNMMLQKLSVRKKISFISAKHCDKLNTVYIFNCFVLTSLIVFMFSYNHHGKYKKSVSMHFVLHIFSSNVT